MNCFAYEQLPGFKTTERTEYHLLSKSGYKIEKVWSTQLQLIIRVNYGTTAEQDLWELYTETVCDKTIKNM